MIQRQGNRGTGRKAALQDGNYAAVDGFTRLCFLAACLEQSSCFSPPISEKAEQAVCPPGIRAERIRADIGFEAASPFPAAGGISLPCLRLPPPRVSGQGAPFPQSPATPPESSFRSLGSLSNLFDEPDILQKSVREYAGSFVLPLVLFRWMWYDTIKSNHKICLYFARG